MGLVDTIHQINMNPDHSVSNNNSFKSHWNAKSFSTFLRLWQLFEAQGFCFSVFCKSDVNV